MLRPIDQYFGQKEEPVRSCLQFMREHILKQDPDISEAWKYGDKRSTTPTCCRRSGQQ